MDAMIAVTVIAFLYFAFRNVGLWRWFWVGLAVYLGFFEGFSVIVTHQTISQQFGLYASIHQFKALMLIGLMILGSIGLGVHLWVMRRKYLKK